MIDEDDVTFTALVAPSGWIGLIILILVLVAYYSNQDECAKRSCPTGQTPVLMHHDCLCVERAR